MNITEQIVRLENKINNLIRLNELMNGKIDSLHESLKLQGVTVKVWLDENKDKLIDLLKEKPVPATVINEYKKEVNELPTENEINKIIKWVNNQL